MSRRPAIDFDEIAPNRFAIGNTQVAGLLKGEGAITGRLFDLTTWRREGLLARLRDRGFAVRTIADRIAALPTPPAAPQAIGGVGWRPLATAHEHYSHFDLRLLRWHPLVAGQRGGVAGVQLCDGWVLRRRKGRGLAGFYLAHKERSGGIGLRAMGETSALLAGYAQALAFDGRPLVAEPAADGAALLPAIELPLAYREVLGLCASCAEDGWLVPQHNWQLAEAIFGRLGLQLSAG